MNELVHYLFSGPFIGASSELNIAVEAFKALNHNDVYFTSLNRVLTAVGAVFGEREAGVMGESFVNRFLETQTETLSTFKHWADVTIESIQSYSKVFKESRVEFETSLKHARLSALNKVEKAEKAAKITKKKGNKHIMMLTKAQQDHEAASREFVSKEMETVRIFDRVEYEGQDAPGWMLEWIAEWSNEIGESKTESLRSDVELEWNPDSKPNEHHSRNDPSLFRSSKLVSASTSVFEMQQKSSSQNFSEVPMIRRLSHWFRSRNCHPEIYQVRKD